MNFKKYQELITRQLNNNDVRERVFQDNVIRPFLQVVLKNVDVEPVDIKTGTRKHDYKQYCGTSSKTGKAVTPDLCIANNWNWENEKNEVDYKAVVEIKSPCLAPITGYDENPYDDSKWSNEINTHLQATRNSLVILTDAVTWIFYTKQKNEKKVFCLGKWRREFLKAAGGTRGRKKMFKVIEWGTEEKFDELKQYLLEQCN